MIFSGSGIGASSVTSLSGVAGPSAPASSPSRPAASSSRTVAPSPPIASQASIDRVAAKESGPRPAIRLVGDHPHGAAPYP